MTEQEKSEDEPRDPRWNKLFDNMTKTQGYKKLWNYFIQITETKPFKEKIARLREKYNIPVSGFKLTKHTWIPPEEWQHKHTEVERQLNDEIEKIMKRMGKEEPKHKIDFNIGEVVGITDGPFKGFDGTVNEIDQTKGKLKVLVNMFGRETPVELDSLQVKKS